MGQAVIGMDPDSKKMSAVITVDDANPVLRQKVLPTSVPDSRKLDVVWSWVYRLVKEYKEQGHDVHLFYEAPFVSPKTIRAVIPLAQLKGAALAAAQRAGAITAQAVVIQTWKKDIIGMGNASKPDIARWCKTCWVVVYKEANGRQDLMDAAAINRHGANLVKRMAKIEKFYMQHPEEAKTKRVRKPLTRSV